ncbi:MAG TPA: DMT family transporter [Myxococcales bacterium]|nr:DMT family transporter [Myxococcales bacterium]
MADLALTLIMAVWGSSFAILRGLFTGNQASPLAIIAVRMALASTLLGAYLFATPGGRAQLKSIKGSLLKDGVFCGALLGIGFLLQTEGLSRTTASRSGFLTGMLVVLVPILEFLLFRKKPKSPALAGILLAFAGMTALSAPWADSSRGTFLGDSLTAACALVFAGHIIALGRVAAKHPLLPLLLLQLATTAVLAAAVGPLIEPQHLESAPNLILAVVYLALFATLLAFGIQTWAQKVMPSVRVALISSLEPVFAALWAALLLNERLSGRELLGGGLIVLGVAVGEAGAAIWKTA